MLNAPCNESTLDDSVFAVMYVFEQKNRLPSNPLKAVECEHVFLHVLT